MVQRLYVKPNQAALTLNKEWFQILAQGNHHLQGISQGYDSLDFNSHVISD